MCLAHAQNIVYNGHKALMQKVITSPVLPDARQVGNRPNALNILLGVSG